MSYSLGLMKLCVCVCTGLCTGKCPSTSLYLLSSKWKLEMFLKRAYMDRFWIAALVLKAIPTWQSIQIL